MAAPAGRVSLTDAGQGLKQERCCMDPTQIEVLRNRLEALGDGMALTLARSSRSTIVRVALDYSTGVLGPSGELLA